MTVSCTRYPARSTARATFPTTVAHPVTSMRSVSRRVPGIPTGALIPRW